MGYTGYMDPLENPQHPINLLTDSEYVLASESALAYPEVQLVLDYLNRKRIKRGRPTI